MITRNELAKIINELVKIYEKTYNQECADVYDFSDWCYNNIPNNFNELLWK